MFAVFHRYDTDGGFGDAILQRTLEELFETREDAQAFVEAFRNPHVYDTPYSDLWCGNLEIHEIPVVQHKDFDIRKFDTRGYWWLPEDRRI